MTDGYIQDVIRRWEMEFCNQKSEEYMYTNSTQSEDPEDRLQGRTQSEVLQVTSVGNALKLHHRPPNSHTSGILSIERK